MIGEWRRIGDTAGVQEMVMDSLHGWWGGTEVSSFTGTDLSNVTRREYSDGSGDLVFQELVSTSRDSHGNLRTNSTERGFLAIADVHAVEDLIRQTLPAR